MNSRTKKILRENLAALGFLAPAGVIIIIFWLLPVVLAFYLSFTDFEMGDAFWGKNARYKVVGLNNYTRLFASEDEGGDREVFVKVLWNTFNYVLWSVPMTIAAGLGLALLLNNKLKGIGIFRTLFFLPHITTWVAIAIIWKFIYNQHLGLGNYLLHKLFGMEQGLKWLAEPTGIVELTLRGLGLDFEGHLHPLLAGPSLSMFSIIITTVWCDTGYFVIIFLAGLQNIDASNYEAAEIDGANAWQKFWNITVPLLSPVLFFLMVISMINAFKVFTPMFVMTPTGGPDQSTLTMVFYLYMKAFGASGKLGFGAAIAFVLLLIILAATLLQRLALGKKVHYS
jgi:multiple sugar transport system permease protein